MKEVRWLTGGADTRLGRERFPSSEYTSSNSMSEVVFGEATNPSFTCNVPVGGTFARVDKILRLYGWVRAIRDGPRLDTE